MSVSLPPDKLADIYQLAVSLLHTQCVTVHWFMSFLGKANNCAIGNFQLWRLCHVIQSDMLTVYHSPTHMFSSTQFSFSALGQLEQLSHLQQNPVPLQFHLLMWLLLQMPCTLIGPFIFRDLFYLYQLVDPGQVLCVGLILSYRSFRLHKMAFHLTGKVVALHLDNSTAKAYLCNQGGTVYPFLSRLACQILSLTDKHSVILIPVYIPTILNVKADYLSQGHLLLKWHLLT